MVFTQRRKLAGKQKKHKNPNPRINIPVNTEKTTDSKTSQYEKIQISNYLDHSDRRAPERSIPSQSNHLLRQAGIEWLAHLGRGNEDRTHSQSGYGSSTRVYDSEPR